MQKIDRLGWAAGLSLSLYGLRVGIRTNNAEVLDRVIPLLPPGWGQADSPFVDHLYSFRVGGANPRSKARHYNLLYSGLAQIARTMDLEEALEFLEADLHYVLAEWAPQRVFIHAGVVGVNGRAIVIPGDSMSGKSTLVKALLEAGATYYSDEYAVLDERGYVQSFPRRLSLRQVDGNPPRRCSAEDLGATTGTDPLPIGLVALAKYRAGSDWKPRPLTAGTAMLEIVKHTNSALHYPEETLAVLHKIAAATPCLRGARGEADETARALIAAVAA